MDKAEYLDPVCCFDASQYTGHPDSEPCASAVNVPEIVKELDRLQNSGQLEQAQRLLEHEVCAARQSGDWRSDLSLQSELMGLHRRTGDKDAARSAVAHGLELIRNDHAKRRDNDEVSRLIGRGASDIPPCFARLFRNARPRRLSLCRTLQQYGARL